MLADDIDEADIRRTFEDFIGDLAFPCVGAKAAMARGTLRIVPCWSVASAWDDVKIHRELLDWAYEYRRDPGLFRSIAFIFAGPAPDSEEAFEAALWDRLQSLAEKDAWAEQPYDARVSPDPENPHFSLSFGGEAFFAVGLHPHASRPARRFRHPVIVLNLHDQFERLRAEGRYEGIRAKIIARDVAAAGSANPMLARHGASSEAVQYSGRVVGEEWRCPFHDPRSDSDSPE